jgi:hypothetical protein
MPRGRFPEPGRRPKRIRSSTAERHVHTVEVGGSAPPGCTWAQSAHLVDGAGWRGRWTCPTSQGVRFSSFTLGLRTRNATQRGGMVTSRVSYARRSPVSTERCDWGRAGRPGWSYQPSASGSAPGAPTISPLWPERKRQLVQTQRVHVRIVSGHLAGDARVAERPLRTRERESSTLSTGSLPACGPDDIRTGGTMDTSRAFASNSRLEHAGRSDDPIWRTI